MKKLVLSFVAIATITFASFGQAPEGFKYQAVLRDAGNVIVTNQAVSLRMTIQQGSIGGTAVYQETFTPTTNAYGLVNLEIGNGTVVSGDFSSIDWSDGPYFIETAADVTGGTTYVVMGTSQLMSVPFALYANTAEYVINDSDSHLTEAEVDAYVSNNGYLINLNGVTETMIEGNWMGGIGDGASGIIGVIPSHRTLHFDVVYSSHDVNSNTNRRNMHKEFIVYREWTNSAIFEDLVVYYDQTTGAAITITFGTNANNEITYDILQTGGSSSIIYYKMSVKLLKVTP